VRRKTLVVAILAICGLAGWLGLSGRARTANADEKAGAEKAPPLVHTVILYLKKDAPEGEVDALIADAHELLRPIPSVRDLRAGKPAENPKPDNFTKNDYQVGLLVLFDNLAGLDAYLKHPMHLKFVDKHKKYIDFDKLLVYDFVNQKK
jgi:hypothetical protein